MLAVFGGARKAVVAREISKVYESVMAGEIQMLADYYALHADECRGEIVVLLEGAEAVDDAKVTLRPQEVFNHSFTGIAIKTGGCAG